MDTTFISIHDLTPDARILYTSDSVIDILGYTPDELVNRSAWEFFPEGELPYAQKFHQQRVRMDQAAVLAYCRVKDKTGNWVGCECCFTVVYDCVIICISIYRRGPLSEKRAQEAPIVRRIFSSSPKDPRYHMLSHLSARFSQPASLQEHEPRAALFLNRFTRTLSVMYATSGLLEIIGISADEMRGRSFYYCIAENCLPDAVKCLENAKGNDSIAYLRFWFRDPRIDDPASPEDDSDEEMIDTETSEEGGVPLRSDDGTSPHSTDSANSNAVQSTDGSMDVDDEPNSRTSSGSSTDVGDTHQAVFGQPRVAESSASSLMDSPEREEAAPKAALEPIELEAVVSCTSDGLVVCLRRARPMIPHPTQRPSRPVHENGLFAAPWASEPILPRMAARPGGGFAPTFAPSLGPQGARMSNSPPAVGGPDAHSFMSAIREQAVFAWALTGINGTLAEYGRGKPSGESLPPDGLPVWANDSTGGNANGKFSSQDSSPGVHLFGDPGSDRSDRSRSASNGISGKGTPFST